MTVTGDAPKRKSMGCKAAAVAMLAASSALAGSDLPAPLDDRDFLFDGRPDKTLVEIGNLLFFDPILSGNRNISCGTCHDPAFGTGDALPLGIGEGGQGRATLRVAAAAVTGRVPRNAQPLYNIGARAYVSMFHDGRLEEAPAGTQPGRFRNPARERLPAGLDSALEAQAFFPVTSGVEMAGQRGENPVATASADRRFGTAWQALADRVDAIPAYHGAFRAAFPDLGNEEKLGYTHVARALAAFQTVAFRSDDSPFDAALRTGDTSVLGETEERGVALFYGKAGCANCHSGPLLTDHAFHAVGMPQIGPGKSHGLDRSYWDETGFPVWLEDEGRFAVTRDAADRYAFRTPSLRNVTLTGPWGHAGSFATLEAVIRHHLDPETGLAGFVAGSAVLPKLGPILDGHGANARQRFRVLSDDRRAAFDLRDGYVMRSPALRAKIAAANELRPVSLDDSEIADLIAFLETLTDPSAVDRSHLIPNSVPSGLPVQPHPHAPNGITPPTTH